MPDALPGLRFLDVLTTGTAVTNYLGAAETTAGHLLAAIAVLNGQTTIDDLGRPVSPLLRSARGNVGVAPAVRDLVQRWFERLGGQGDAELLGAELLDFIADLHSIDSGTPGG